MPGPQHPLDPTGPAIIVFSSLYGAQGTAQQYEDGWVFELEGLVRTPYCPEGRSKSFEKVLHGLYRSIILGVSQEGSRFRIGYWVPNALFEEVFPHGLPMPGEPTRLPTFMSDVA